MDVTRRSRTPPQAARPDYDAYIRSPQWRRRRNRALKLAQFTCQRCGGKRELQVHHTTYERLGAELDSDLEVVCRGCHLGHHAMQAWDSVAVYVKLVSSAIQSGKYASIADLSDAVKDECVRLNLPTDKHQVESAIRLVDERLPVVLPKKLEALFDVSRDDQPLTRAEAASIIARLREKAAIPMSINHMPTVVMISQREADSRRAMAMVEQEMVESLARCEALELKVKR